jgi:hypothetical protein
MGVQPYGRRLAKISETIAIGGWVVLARWLSGGRYYAVTPEVLWGMCVAFHQRVHQSSKTCLHLLHAFHRD